MTKFYFIRHGKTQWNLEGRYQGANGDSPLLPESFEDIKYLANYLKEINFTSIYSSPLKRAKTTAETLETELGKELPIIICDDLKEFNLGIMEGQKFVDVEKKYPELIWAFRNSPKDYREEIIQGESFENVIRRTNEAINMIAQAAKLDDEFIIVSHGAALVTMIQSLLGTKLPDLRKDGGLSNTSVTVLETFNSGQTYKLLEWNNTDFLVKKTDPTDTI